MRPHNANGQRIALRTAAGVTYIHSDHLGSTSVTSGAQSGDIKYFPYGATRSGAVSTTYKFTGQRLDDSTGLFEPGPTLSCVGPGSLPCVEPSAHVPRILPVYVIYDRIGDVQQLDFGQTVVDLHLYN